MKIKFIHNIPANRYILTATGAVVLVLLITISIYLYTNRTYFKNTQGWQKSGSTLYHLDPKTKKPISTVDLKTIKLSASGNTDQLKTKADTDCSQSAKKNNTPPSFSETTFRGFHGFKCFYESAGSLQNSVYYLPNSKKNVYYLITISYPKDNRREIAKTNDLINGLVLH